MEIKIVSIERYVLADKKITIVVFKFGKRQKVQNIISDEDLTEDYILNYLKNINH
jgi:hypothetical protein